MNKYMYPLYSEVSKLMNQRKSNNLANTIFWEFLVLVLVHLQTGSLTKLSVWILGNVSLTGFVLSFITL